jgi:hypothetical protein
MVWIILGIFTVILLIIYFFKGRNAVWGGLMIGVVIGFVTSIILAIKGNGFNWFIILKTSIVVTLAGFITELLPIIGKLIIKSIKSSS